MQIDRALEGLAQVDRAIIFEDIFNCLRIVLLYREKKWTALTLEHGLINFTLAELFNVEHLDPGLGVQATILASRESPEQVNERISIVYTTKVRYLVAQFHFLIIIRH